MLQTIIISILQVLKNYIFTLQNFDTSFLHEMQLAEKYDQGCEAGKNYDRSGIYKPVFVTIC